MADQKSNKYINHKLTRVDTLVSLALKYNVTVQDLKKENKIWNTDHLFLRETLLIPLTSENENILDENDIVVVFDGNSSNAASPSSSQTHLPNGDGVESSSSPSHPHDSSSSASTATKIRSLSTPSDFFSKYDTSIAQLKGDVAKMEQNAATLEEIIDSNSLSLPPRKGSAPSHRDSNSSTSSSSERRGCYMSDEDGNSSPVLPLTSTKHVKSAIENLEQVNDDIFEL